MSDSSKAKIILFSGKAENGKTTAAKIAKNILENAGYKVVKLAYADYVKYTAKTLFDWDGKKDGKGRELLQWWGTDKVRTKSPNFWVDTIIHLVDIIQDMYDFIIIDDARFPNEIDSWKDYKTFPIRVERPQYQNILTTEQSQHESECALDKYPFKFIVSAANIKELECEIFRIMLAIEAEISIGENKNEFI